MTNSKAKARPAQVIPLSIDELEAGLRIMGRRDTDLDVFWDENVDAFKQTVLLAIRETSDALLSPTITLRWRVTLQRQLEELVGYVELADRYIARRVNCAQQAPELPASLSRIH